MFIKLLLFVILTFQAVHVQCAELVDPCEQHTTCRACIRATPLCKWCLSAVKSEKRCMGAAVATKCPDSDIQYPSNQATATENISFSDMTGHVTQIKPQRFQIVLRPIGSQQFDFEFMPAKDYPVDLYFLFDSSYTMKNVIKTTANASKEIYEEMRKKTKNVKLGLGTFIDKNAAPYLRDKLSEPITSFRHHLDMTSDFTSFSDEVNKIRTGTNYDPLEGGFDALSQVIACNKIFGFRCQSRKIIFLFTNALLHSAGDGKFAGIVQPYDGQCYTVNNIYTKELKMDYPSISMLSEQAEKEDMNIVFIVKKKDAQAYKHLTNYVYGSKYLAFFEEEEEVKGLNIEKIITEVYEEFTDTLKLNLQIASDDQEFVKNNMKFLFEPSCDKIENTKNADCKVPLTHPKHIKGTVSLLRYVGKDNLKVNITVEGIKEKIVLDINVADCNCEEEVNSTFCSGNGTKRCGVCECNENKSGPTCQCDANDKKKIEHTSNLVSECKPPNSNNTLDCNGFGDCICNKCQCNKIREGPYCQCEKNSCIDNCNGHGICYCGICTCKKGWTGVACNCEEDKPCEVVNGKICNNRGSCKCGKCECDEPAKWDARLSQNYITCQMNNCTNCHYNQCDKLKECVICHLNKDSDCLPICTKDIKVTLLNETINEAISKDTFICENVQVDAGCYTQFQYRYDDDNYGIHLLIQTKKDCLTSYLIWGGGVFGLILLIGLLTLVGWKLLTDFRDRQEYNRFLKMHDANDAVCENPIYEPATTMFRNPAFRKRSVDYTLR